MIVFNYIFINLHFCVVTFLFLYLRCIKYLVSLVGIFMNFNTLK